MKRIAIISDHASPLAPVGSVDSGGQNIYVRNVARMLVERGHRIDIFTRRDAEDLDRVVHVSRNLRVIHLNAGPPSRIRKEDLLEHMDEFAASMLDFIAREEPYDIIHANFFMSGLVAMRIKACHDTPFFITFHALGRVRRFYQRQQDRFSDARFLIEERIMRCADGIIAECPQDRQDIIDFYGADPAKIAVIPCGVDLDELYPVSGAHARRRLGLERGERTVLQLGRLVPRKGIDTVIRAVALLNKRDSLRVRCLIVGGDSSRPDPRQCPELARLDHIAREEDIRDMIDFRGQADRHEIKYYYCASDIFVSTPWYEPFGITPLEAMACGRPVIGSRVGGIKYSVEEGKTGLLVPPLDPEALAEAMASLFRNPSLLRSFGCRGRRRVKKHFTWRHVAHALDACFEDALRDVEPCYHAGPSALAAFRHMLSEETP